MTIVLFEGNHYILLHLHGFSVHDVVSEAEEILHDVPWPSLEIDLYSEFLQGGQLCLRASPLRPWPRIEQVGAR